MPGGNYRNGVGREEALRLLPRHRLSSRAALLSCCQHLPGATIPRAQREDLCTRGFVSALMLLVRQCYDWRQQTTGSQRQGVAVCADHHPGEMCVLWSCFWAHRRGDLSATARRRAEVPSGKGRWVHPVNLSAVRRSRPSPQPWSRLFPNAASHQIKTICFFIRLNAVTTFWGIATSRGDLYHKFFFTQWISENLLGFRSNLDKGYTGHVCSSSPPRKWNATSQDRVLLHSLVNSLLQTRTSQATPCSDAHSKKPSARSPQAETEPWFLLSSQGTEGSRMSTSLTY